MKSAMKEKIKIFGYLIHKLELQIKKQKPDRSRAQCLIKKREENIYEKNELLAL